MLHRILGPIGRLGTAALKNVGSGAGDIPTNSLVAVPRYYIDGFNISNSGNTITVGSGCLITGNAIYNFAGGSFTKDMGSSFVEGTGNGGLGNTVSLPTSGTLHLFLAVKDSDGTTLDIFGDTDVGGANNPTGWTTIGRITSRPTDASANILSTVQRGDWHDLTVAQLDINTTGPGTAAVLAALSVPGGINVEAKINLLIANNLNGAKPHVLLTAPDVTDQAPSTTAAPLASFGVQDNNPVGATQQAAGERRVWTDTSRQIRYRCTDSDSNATIYIATLGWLDLRGKDA